MIPFLLPYGNEDDILRVTLAHAGPRPNGGRGDIKVPHSGLSYGDFSLSRLTPFELDLPGCVGV